MKRIITLLTLLAMLVGSPLFSREQQEVQVVKHDTSYPIENSISQALVMQQGINYDSLAHAVLFIAGPSTTPDISNYNKNYVTFVHEDTVFTENVVQILDELSNGFTESVGLMATEIAKEVGKRLDLILETLVRRKQLEAKAYLAWPILIALSLALLAFSTMSERRLLQYIAASLFVASVIGGLVYLPDILIGLSTHEYDIYNLLIDK